MKTYLKLTLVLSLLALAGCGKEEQKSPEQPQAETSKRPVQESPPDWTGDDHPSQSVGSKYRWDQEQILKRHEELAMKPLPAYINEVWGAGGMPKEGDVLSDWAFVVPKDRIGDFEDYLRNLGVPEEFMTGDSPYRSGKQENWKAPDRPVDKLEFLMARTIPGNGRRRGLDFVAGQTRLYRFRNPNFSQFEITIYFDPVTGNSYISER